MANFGLPQTKKRTGWSNDFLAKKYADTDVDSSMYREAARQEPEETAAFRARKSARDRMLGLNVGQVPGGERLHPMMPGAAGMGTGPSQVNPMMGDKAAWYVNKENFKHDPNTAERTGRLLSENFYGGSGSVISPEDAIDIGQSVGSSERINALKQIGGLAGAGRAGFMDRYVTGGPSEKMTDAQRLGILLARRNETFRKEDRLGDVKDPTSIAGRMQARGEAKAAERAQRMLGRASVYSGEIDDASLARAALSGSSAAVQLLELRTKLGIASAGAAAAKYGVDASKEVGMADVGVRKEAITSDSETKKLDIASRGDIAKGGYASAEKIASTDSADRRYGVDTSLKETEATIAGNKDLAQMQQESADLDRQAKIAMDNGNRTLALELATQSNALTKEMGQLQATTQVQVSNNTTNAQRDIARDDNSTRLELGSQADATTRFGVASEDARHEKTLALQKSLGEGGLDIQQSEIDSRTDLGQAGLLNAKQMNELDNATTREGYANQLDIQRGNNDVERERTAVAAAQQQADATNNRLQFGLDKKKTDFAMSGAGQKAQLLSQLDPNGIPAAVRAGSAIFGGSASPGSNIAATARWGGRVTPEQGAELATIADDVNLDDTEKTKLIIDYGRANNWDDNKINLLITHATGNRAKNTRSPSGWGNIMGLYKTNTETGAVQNATRRFGGLFGF